MHLLGPISTVLLVVALISCCKGDTDNVFSSTFELHRLVLREAEFSADLRLYAKALQDQLAAVNKFLDATYPRSDVVVRSAEEAEAYVSHPINALGLLRRTAFETNHNLLQQTITDADLLQQRVLGHLESFPPVSDYRDAASSVSLLQETYGLDLAELSSGIVSFGGGLKVQSDHVPSWHELYELATAACNRGWWDTGLTWYKLAIEKCRGSNSNSSGGQECIDTEKQFESGKKIHDQLLEKRGQISVDHRCFHVPFDKKLAKKKKYSKKGLSKKSRSNVVTDDATPGDRMLKDRFYQICNGEVEKEDAEGNLKCGYLHHNNAYLVLGPFKMEEKSEAPFVVVLHDFLSQKDIDHMTEYAKTKLRRSETGREAALFTGLTRTSKQTWLKEMSFTFNETKPSLDSEEPPPIPFEPLRYIDVEDDGSYRISLRIQNATLLSLLKPFSSESYQIANYGLGGQYSSHVDAFGVYDIGSDGEPVASSRTSVQRIHDRAAGDRLATFMAYLSDVVSGGKTVFPLVGASVQATKGSAVFWVNMHSDGTRDMSTFHGGCPVLIGSKWITNKWVFYHDQFDKLPCSVRKGERIDLLSEWRKNKAILS